MDLLHEKLDYKDLEWSFLEIARGLVVATAERDRHQLSEMQIPSWVIKIRDRLNQQKSPRVIGTEQNDCYRVGKRHGLLLSFVIAANHIAERVDVSPSNRDSVASLYRGFACLLAERKPDSGEFDLLVEALQADIFQKLLALGAEARRLYLSGLLDGCSPQARYTDNTEILRVLYMSWPVVIKMESVSQLHRFLDSIFGSNRIGDSKRIENICRRYGIHLGKVGRPRKSHQSPNA